MLAVKIRLAQLSEATILTELSLRSKKSNGYDDAFMEACREELTVTKTQMIEDEYWVAQQDDICGCVCFTADEQNKSGEINAFFVDPHYQRFGIGKLLWDKVLERAHQKGLVTLRLDSDPFAVSFYEAMGFECIGETPSGSIKGRVIPRMEIRIE
jgi:N-acetylglutamate synthase-like GNAT family acetyltransferase